jgi:hypothetical protein
MGKSIWTDALAGTLALAALPGCSMLLPNTETEVEALIQLLPSSPAQVTVPATVRVGETFTVQIVTHGGGCMRKGRTREQTTDLTAELRPYDVEVEADVCTAEATTYRHSASVRFNRSGTGTVQVYGRSEPGNELITVTRTVTVAGD